MSLKHLAKATVGAAFLCGEGCEVPEYHLITEEHKEVVQEAFKQAERGARLQRLLFEAADGESLTDSDGNTGSEAFIAEYDEALDVAGRIVQADRVVAYRDEEKNEFSGTILHQAMYFEDDLGPAIGINIACENPYSALEDDPSVLPHEGAHAKYGSHQGKMTGTWIESHTSIHTKEFCATAREEKDVPYIISLSSSLPQRYLFVIDAFWDLPELAENIETATTDAYVRQLAIKISSQKEQTKEMWVDAVIDDVWSEYDAECFAEFGLSKEKTRTALLQENTLYEEARGEWLEGADELEERAWERYHELREEREQRESGEASQARSRR